MRSALLPQLYDEARRDDVPFSQQSVSLDLPLGGLGILDFVT